MNIQQIKVHMPLVTFLVKEGYKVRPVGLDNGRMLCCFHKERTASMHIYGRSQKYHCFGCGAHGDIIDLVKHFKLTSSTKEAIYYLNRRIKGLPMSRTPAINGSLTKKR